ncbi:uncharacterized protein K02A2.6-like [Armigeres subalbatus]|uniref:uncharacterized protein K02A2.6-like n=1 Tax=Armigeres subalbatus TaxID=124917 RepID=UPI002ECFFD0F
MDGEEYHIGAVIAPPRKKKKSKLHAAMQELSEANSSNAHLAEELAKAQATIRALQGNLSSPRCESEETNSVEFDNGLGPSSTKRQTESNRHSGHATVELSRFVSSMNQISVSSISVPECKASAEGEDISRHDFEAWQDLLTNSMALAGISDETTQFIVFKVKAGQKLLEVYRATETSSDAPDLVTCPYSNAVYRLKKYYASTSDVMLQRRRLALMTQQPEESDLSFIRRVGLAARQCDYPEAKLFEEVLSTVAEQAKHREVRVAALKMMSRKASLQDLIDKVREIETIRLNEAYVSKKQSVVESVPVSVNVVQAAAGPSRYVARSSVPAYGRTPLQRSNVRENRGQRTVRGSRGSGMVWRNADSMVPDRCTRCNSVYHSSERCFAIKMVCHNCGGVGHLLRACSKPVITKNMRYAVDRRSNNTPFEVSSVATKDETKLNEGNAAKPVLEPNTNTVTTLAVVCESKDSGEITASVAGMPCKFLIDSGAQVNTMTAQVFEKLIANDKYSKELHNIQQGTDRILKPYAAIGGINVLCTFEAFLHISEDRPTLLEKFYVVQEVRSLLSRATATRYSILLLGLNVPVRDVSAIGEFDSKWEKISFICSDTIFPKFNIPSIKISYDSTKPPCRNIYMNIPVAMKSVVSQRLEKLTSAGIIERVTDEMDTSFCSSMLVVPKGPNDFRLVVDLRGPNQCILVKLEGAKWFSTIDLASAFFHVELHENSRHLTNFMTEFGMFRYARLPFGLCNSPDIFQEIMERIILEDCEGVVNYLDDVLVFGATKQEHDRNLEAVQSRLKDHNVQVNAKKCVYGSQSVKFVGFELTNEGWRIEQEKINAIKLFKPPTSCAEVKSFLGLITFVDKFLIDRATKTVSLRTLANAAQFYWTEAEETEFIALQTDAIEAIKTLGYFSNSDKTELFVDASAVGLGAVLVQYNTNGTPRIIACASKALTNTEQNYPQSHREALAVVWGVERFAFYLTGRSFVVRTDATANEFIYHSNHRIGKRAFSRAEGYALRLQPYDFTLERIGGQENVADALSRLIRDSQSAEPFEDDNDSNVLCTLDAGCMEISLSEIEKCAEQDEEMKSLRYALEHKTWSTDLKQYEAHKKNMHSLGALICKGDRIILPKALRIKAITSAHSGHIGEVAMKRIMRDFFWWPRMGNEIEKFIKSCETCVLLSRRNPPVPLSSREMPQGPWEIIQIDFLMVPGFGTGEFLMIVDTYSRFLVVIEMHRTNADATNAALQDTFKRWGLPLIIQSDNGPPFQSSAFCNHWQEKGVRVRKSVPLSPQSNGLVERQNQSIIKTLSAAKIEGKSWRNALENFVHNHNTLIPHSRLKVTPFELLVGWKYRGTFPSLWNETEVKELDRVKVREADADAKLVSAKYADLTRGAKPSDIHIGDIVFLKQPKKSKVDATFSSERYTVVAQEGSKMVVTSSNGVQYARSVNDLKKVPGPSSVGIALEPDISNTSEDLMVTEEVQENDTEQARPGLRQRDEMICSTIKMPATMDEPEEPQDPAEVTSLPVDNQPDVSDQQRIVADDRS